MKNSQKGFAIPLLIAIIVVLVIGGVYFAFHATKIGYYLYFYTQNKPQQIKPQPIINNQINPASTSQAIKQPSATSTPLQKVTATPAQINEFVSANNQFAFDLYSRYQTTQSNTNIFYSPYSITTALGMTYEGARGQTAVEMQKVLHIPESAEARRATSLTIIDSLNKTNQSFTLRTANALWAEKTFAFLPDFFSIVKNYYNGSVTNLDFINNSENSRVVINSWVAKQTNDKIQNLIPEGVINSMTRLVLTNAIYFKGTWKIAFDKKYTMPADFKLTSETKTSVPMMTLSGEKAMFKYIENNNEQVIKLPYQGDRLSMMIILPKNSTMSSVESPLTADSVTKLIKSMQSQRVDVFLPKFTFKTKYEMANDLKALGMPTAFLESADFSGMDGKKDLSISQVIHQAFIDVNEEGTEAAAATAVIMMPTSAGPNNGPKIPVFRADHPFIFLIQDDSTGEILFIGRVMNPSVS